MVLFEIPPIVEDEWWRKCLFFARGALMVVMDARLLGAEILQGGNRIAIAACNVQSQRLKIIAISVWLCQRFRRCDSELAICDVKLLRAAHRTRKLQILWAA